MPVPIRVVAICIAVLAIFVIFGGLKAMFFAAYFLFLIPIFYFILFFKADVRPPLQPETINEYHFHTHLHQARSETYAQEISSEHADGSVIRVRSIQRIE